MKKKYVRSVPEIHEQEALKTVITVKLKLAWKK